MSFLFCFFSHCLASPVKSSPPCHGCRVHPPPSPPPRHARPITTHPLRCAPPLPLLLLLDHTQARGSCVHPSLVHHPVTARKTCHDATSQCYHNMATQAATMLREIPLQCQLNTVRNSHHDKLQMTGSEATTAGAA
ncbi:hypothetical protein EDB89DRAFT_1977142, partial [Lactarius sanguifluus]